MPHRYDPFEDPLITRGLQHEPLENILTLTRTAKTRWESYRELAMLLPALVAIFAFNVCLFRKELTAAFLCLFIVWPLQRLALQVGRRYLVERALLQIRRAGDYYR